MSGFRATRFKLGDLVQPRFEVTMNPHAPAGYYISTQDVGVVTQIREEEHGISIHALFRGRFTSWSPDALRRVGSV
jgi:hypothetical protein